MQVKNVSRVGFAARGAAEQKRYLTVGNGLLGEVIINNQCRATGIAKEFSDGSARKGSKKLQGRRVCCVRSHDGRVGHSSLVFEVLGQGRNR